MKAIRSSPPGEPDVAAGEFRAGVSDLSARALPQVHSPFATPLRGLID